RTDPVRPRLTLVLGADTDNLYYPTREIRLKKWDKYQFAQGVVLLAVNDMLPSDMRISLTRLAVTEAESTVEVNDLKSSRTPPYAGPRLTIRRTPTAPCTRPCLLPGRALY